MGSNSIDIEASGAVNEFLDGYVDFAEFIASDAELSIFRQFRSLSARNLLYLEAELQLLQFELQEIDNTDQELLEAATESEGKIKVEEAIRAWECLKQQARSDTRQGEKLGTIMKLRTAMKDYEEALLRRSQVLALQKPQSTSFRAFKNWFRDKKPLRGSGWHLLDDEEDFVSLHVEKEPDRLSAMMHHYFGYHLRKERETPKSWGPMYYYPAERIAWIVAVLCVLISVILLIGAIVVLYFVKPIEQRLAVVGSFTFLFAASIALLTNSRRAEVFGATAAYAAVLVVFGGAAKDEHGLCFGTSARVSDANEVPEKLQDSGFLGHVDGNLLKTAHLL